MLADVLDAVGIQSEIHEDFTVVEDGSILDFDMLTLNCVRWTCSQSQVNPAWRKEWHFKLSEDARRGFLAFLAQGKGFLALHAATLCFDDWPEYRKILGGWWDWEQSGHAPFRRHAFSVHTGKHPITEGIRDFEIDDELYTSPVAVDSVCPLIEGEWEGKRHPVLWLHTYGPARICYNALGHGPEAFEHSPNRTLLQRGAQWVLNRVPTGPERV